LSASPPPPGAARRTRSVGFLVARRPGAVAALFLGPAMALYLAFVLYPVLMTFYNSFHTLRADFGFTTEFVGLANFSEILAEDVVFRRAVVNTLVWGVAGALLEILLGLVLAVFLYFRVPWHRAFRALWFTPVLMSYPVVGIIWLWYFNYDWGAINSLLRSVGLGALAQSWLSSPATALPSLIVVTTWMWTGFNMVVLLAALHAIPQEYVDGARVDGGSLPQVVLGILIPLARPTIVNLLILSFIGKMKQFALVWVMTRGGPLWATETVATYVVKRAFHWRTFDLGYPSAIAVIWFVIVFGLSLLLTRALQRRELIQY
jgi:raffinose/stachyose/melibiose transport system permease protein